jgi:hypothetical protein
MCGAMVDDLAQHPRFVIVHDEAVEKCRERDSNPHALSDSAF